WTLSVPAADVGALTDGVYPINASVADAAGNPASDSTDISVDETAPTITITTPIAVDDVINAAESGLPLTIAGTTTGVEVGQIVTVTLNGLSYTATVDAAGAWTLSVPAADVGALTDGVYPINASVADAAGNPASDSTDISVDETAPTITITTPIAVDDVINAAESGLPLTIAGTTTGVEVGQIVTVTLNGLSYTATVDAAGAWTLSVPA